MCGFKSRISRYLKSNKRPRWHIDYLLDKAAIKSMILCETKHKAECTIAQALHHQFDSIPGFGSTDCRCYSHLFFALDEGQMESSIMATLDLLSIQPRLERVGL